MENQRNNNIEDKENDPNIGTNTIVNPLADPRFVDFLKGVVPPCRSYNRQKFLLTQKDVEKHDNIILKRSRNSQVTNSKRVKLFESTTDIKPSKLQLLNNELKSPQTYLLDDMAFKELLGSYRVIQNYRREKLIVTVTERIEHPAVQIVDANFVLIGTPNNVYIHDMEKLTEGVMLNDRLINFFLNYAAQELKGYQDDLYIFDTNWYTQFVKDVNHALPRNGINTQLTENFTTKMYKWTRKIKIFEKNLLTIPINMENHWLLITIVEPRLLIETSDKSTTTLLMDSLPALSRARTAVLDNIKHYLSLEWNLRYKTNINLNRIRFVTPRHTPRQPLTSVDCGVYLIAYTVALYADSERAKKLAEGVYFNKVLPNFVDLLYMRLKIVAAIHHKVTAEKWAILVEYDRRMGGGVTDI